MSDATIHGELRIDGRPARWRRDGAADGRPLLILAHGAGAPLDSPFMAAVSAGLVLRGSAVARFNFPYMEARGEHPRGRAGPPDREPVLLATWRAMLVEAHSWSGSGTLVVGGKSLGGRMASLLLAREGDQRAAGAVWFGYPLHPAGRTDRLRAAHLPQVPVPQLFVSGTRDPLCDLELLRPVLAPLGGRARLVAVAGGDHSLAVSRSAPLRGADAWLDEVAAFVRSLAD